MIAGKLILSGIVVAMVLSTVLWALAALHFYWGAGGIWPAKDETSLARQVVGAPGIRKMPPPLACMSVAAMLAMLGALPLLLLGILPVFLPAWSIFAAGVGATLVFLARGWAAWHPKFRKHFPEEPFATLDRRYYAPLCLAIGTGFAFLMIAG
jgi:hypothetical protein